MCVCVCVFVCVKNRQYAKVLAEHFNIKKQTNLRPAQDARKLLEAGFRVVVERSPTRCFKDEDYSSVGCRLAEPGSWVKAPDSAIIVGLKELPEVAKGAQGHALKHRHVFFAHCFKRQAGWAQVLDRFASGRGLLWDLEFLVDEAGRRVAAFGRPAGVVGAAVGLLNWCQQQLGGGAALQGPLASWRSTQAMVEAVRAQLAAVQEKQRQAQGAGAACQGPRVLVIGALGRCGNGAVWFAQQCGLGPDSVTQWDLQETRSGGPFPELLQADVLVNCIYLGATKIQPFLTSDMIAAEGRRCVRACVRA